MWKAVGSVQSGDDKSMRSNRSRIQTQMEPFHQGLKRRSNLSPQANRSFCQDYFERHRHNTLNMTAYSNKSQKNLRNMGERDDMFTQMRNRATKEQMSSKLDSLRDNPEGGDRGKAHEKVKLVNQKLHVLKKDQKKLKTKLQQQFDNFKNCFYQLQQKMIEIEQSKDTVQQPTSSVQKVDEELIKGILSEAVDIQKYFADMDRKKAAIMQELS